MSGHMPIEDVPLYGSDGNLIVSWLGTKNPHGWPLYGPGPIAKLNVMTEWVFDQASYGSPDALINGVVVCAGHSTEHIIDYVVTDDPESHWDERTKSYIFTFTMSIVPKGEGAVGGSCVFRCWDYKYPSFNTAPTNSRASVSGNQSTVARYRAQFFINSREWLINSI